MLIGVTVGYAPFLSDSQTDVLLLHYSHHTIKIGGNNRNRTYHRLLAKHPRPLGTCIPTVRSGELHHDMKLAKALGIEPKIAGLESAVLPLTLYSYMFGCESWKRTSGGMLMRHS
jgi:hypothetical protein